VVVNNDLGVSVTVMNGDLVMVTSKGALGNVSYLMSSDPHLLPLIRPKPLRAWVDNIKNPGKGDAKSGRTPSVDFEVMYKAFRTAPERGEWPTGRGREAAIMRWIAGWRDDERLPDLGQTQLKKYAGDLMEREEYKGRY